MTNEDKLLLQELRENTQQLFERIDKSESEKKLIEEKVLELETKIESLEQEKLELSQRIENIRLAKQVFSGTDEKQEAKQRINKLVREIDKCIALLNK